MTIRKLLTLACATWVFFWTPTIISTTANAAIPCGLHAVEASILGDTAYASFTPPPCNTKTPWFLGWIFAGSASVIVDALIVARTQCRELTQQEAMQAGFLPFSWLIIPHKKKHHC